MSSRDLKKASPDDDPVNRMNGAELDRRLFGTRKLQTVQDWSLPLEADRLPVDSLVDRLIELQPAGTGLASSWPRDRSPYLFVRHAIREAAQLATMHWFRVQSAKEKSAALERLAEGLLTTAETLASIVDGPVTAEDLAEDLTAVLPRDYRDPRLVELRNFGLDFEAVVRAGRTVRPELDRVAERAREIVEEVRRQRGGQLDVWANAFAHELERAWHSLTGRQFQRSTKSLSGRFVLEAYRTLGGTQRKSFVSRLRALAPERGAGE